MNNKYLEKIAERVGYNVNYNYHENNDYEDKHLSRMYKADEANELLLSHGYNPVLTESAPDYSKANVLTDLDFKSTLRPHEVDANVKGIVSGLVTGGAVGLGVMARSGNPLLGWLAGVPTAYVAGKAVKNWTYGDSKRTEDDEAVKVNTNKLLEHLTKNYQKA